MKYVFRQRLCKFRGGVVYDKTKVVNGRVGAESKISPKLVTSLKDDSLYDFQNKIISHFNPSFFKFRIKFITPNS